MSSWSTNSSIGRPTDEQIILYFLRVWVQLVSGWAQGAQKFLFYENYVSFSVRIKKFLIRKLKKEKFKFLGPKGHGGKWSLKV